MKKIILTLLVSILATGSLYANQTYNPFTGNVTESNKLKQEPVEKSLVTAEFKDKTIEVVLSRKNARMVQSVLGEPDKKIRKQRKLYYIYNNPKVKFANLANSPGELVVVLRNGSVTDILYDKKRNRIVIN